MWGEGGTEIRRAIHVSNRLVSLTLDHVPATWTFPKQSGAVLQLKHE